MTMNKHKHTKQQMHNHISKHTPKHINAYAHQKQWHRHIHKHTAAVTVARYEHPTRQGKPPLDHAKRLLVLVALSHHLRAAKSRQDDAETILSQEGP